MASERPKRDGVYVYNIVPDAPVKHAISKGWGSLMKSKTYRERSEREKVGVAAVEGRKSSVSEAEGSTVGSAAAFLQVKVLVSDMPAFMQVHAFRCARTTFDGLDKFSSKYMAYNIKKLFLNVVLEDIFISNPIMHQRTKDDYNEFDKVYGPAWHCIVGSSFGSYVTHSTGCFLYFSMENLHILLFRTKVERA